MLPAQRPLSWIHQSGGRHLVAVLVHGRGSVLGEPHFREAPDEDAVGFEMRKRLHLAKEIGLGIDEIR
jgi:hypothetical protein